MPKHYVSSKGGQTRTKKCLSFLWYKMLELAEVAKTGRSCPHNPSKRIWTYHSIYGKWATLGTDWKEQVRPTVNMHLLTDAAGNDSEYPASHAWDIYKYILIQIFVTCCCTAISLHTSYAGKIALESVTNCMCMYFMRHLRLSRISGNVQKAKTLLSVSN